ASQARLFGVKVVEKHSQPHTWLSALLRAIDWISQQAQKKQIQLANLSLQIYGQDAPLLNEFIDRSIKEFNVTYIVAAGNEGVDILTTGPGGNYQNGRKTSGTSMAAPHVTGVAALYILKYRQEHAGRNPTPQQIKAALRQHAVPQSRPCSTPLSGDGGFSGDPDNTPEPLLHARPLLPTPPPTRQQVAPHRARP
ncbi:MAG: S8 family serine peptidase, partial [Abditibacteriales bacterium]|nr:S8 family serine peptidase [Abditibacteriales bacterium]MDW8367303.1 S8 family serine peptidase [Abditibacteriales bacterium]